MTHFNENANGLIECSKCGSTNVSARVWLSLQIAYEFSDFYKTYPTAEELTGGTEGLELECNDCELRETQTGTSGRPDSG